MIIIKWVLNWWLVTDAMANQSESSVEECVSIEESDIAPTPDPGDKLSKILFYYSSVLLELLIENA